MFYLWFFLEFGVGDICFIFVNGECYFRDIEKFLEKCLVNWGLIKFNLFVMFEV